MDNENHNKKDNESGIDIKDKNISNPLCKNGVCKIPDNNLKKENIINKKIMINIE